MSNIRTTNGTVNQITGTRTGWHMPKHHEPMSALDAAIDAGALFEVKSEPMSVAGHVPTIAEGKYKGEPLQKIIYRERQDGTPKVLNVVHPSFPESNYLQLIEQAEALFPESTTSLTVLDEGERLFFTQEIGEEIDLGGGDIIRPHLLWTGSLNSSWSSGGWGLNYRFSCSNQLPMAEVMFKARRTLNHDQNLAVRALILSQMTQGLEAFGQKVSTLKGIRVSEAQLNGIIERLLPEPAEDAHGKTRNTWETKVSAIRYFWKEEQDGPAPGTAWAAWNAFQSAESHVFTKGAAQEVRTVEQVVNNRLPVTSQAEERLLALV